MPLDGFQKEILEVIRHNRTASSPFAGGAVIQQHGFRLTDDQDIFTAGDPGPVMQLDAQALRTAGFTVEETKSLEGFRECRVTRPGIGTAVLQWTQALSLEYFAPVPDPAFGQRLHFADLSANKTLAAAGRVAMRDFIDLWMLDRCRNGAANQAGVGLARNVAGLVSLSLPRTTCAIVGGGGIPEGTLPEPIATERTTTMEIFIGLDVSVASTSVCALNANGETVNDAKVPSDPESLVEHLRGLPGRIAAVGLEAGPLSQWLHKGLSEAGFETVLMETKRVKSALKAAPVKTDRRDAEGIAHLLRMGWFQPVHCKSVPSQEKRALLGSRNALVEGIVRLELSVRGILRNFGLKLGRVSKGRWEQRVRELASDNAMLSDAVAPILRLRAQMRDELAMMTKRVRSLALSDATCRQLMTMPGVGPVTALTFVTAVDDPARFRRARDIGAWAGLTPKKTDS